MEGRNHLINPGRDDEMPRQGGVLTTRLGGGSGVKTLQDIIRQEQEAHGGVYMDGSSGINWKAFKDRIRLRRAGNAWADVVAGRTRAVRPSPISDPELRPSRPNPVFGRSVSRSVSVINRERPLMQPVFSRANIEEPLENLHKEEESSGGPAPAQEGGERPMGMSLMSLLDTEWEDDEDGEEENDDDDDDGDGCNAEEEMEYTCCVCMVQHKGAAFIPCAHTFCRLCSRELWVSRGNCPLCNGYILEILDIF